MLPVLAVENLAIRFAGAPADTVQGLSFSVHRGETLAVVGESGCGKSLTALALLGLLPAGARVSSGRARLLDDARPDSVARARGDRVGMIFQEPMTSLNPALTIGEQIAETVRRHRGLPRAQAWRRAVEMLHLVSIPAPEQRARRYPHELSGGMRQRVMIAIALANDPALLIADEPTTALDVTIQAQILALIARLQAGIGMALLLITHDLGVVAEIADRVAVMYAGQVLETGPVAALFDDPQHPYTIGLMGAIPSPGAARLAAIPGTVPSISAMPAGCRFSGRCPFADARCRTKAPAMRNAGPGHAVACWKAPIEAWAA